MARPSQLLISDLLRARLRHQQGDDCGSGHQAWMHPPCHRLLGWSARPAGFGPRRTVWRLDQLLDLVDGTALVAGEAEETDQSTLDLLPTLLDANLISRSQRCLGRVVDGVVEVSSGCILQYLVARSDPRLPGTSRWRLTPDRLLDQQPGEVVAALEELDDLPLAKASIRQQMLRRTRQFRDQVPDSFDSLEDRLRSWGDRLWEGGDRPVRPDDQPDGDPWI
jgi:hypothetical protein